MDWLFKRKRKGASGSGNKTSHQIQRDPDFPRLDGVHYLDFLAKYHVVLQPRTYLEIGTQKGRSLAMASCPSIAIDPAYCLEKDVIGMKPSLFLYQGTSDAFFNSGHLNATGQKLDFAFLDGMHLFDYLLRDFMNVERHSSPDSTIALHDCVPYALVMADRTWDKAVTKSWTGDVWKMLLILEKYRPDLKVEVLDCPPTALVLVSNLDPNSTHLHTMYDQILDEYLDLTLEQYGVERFVAGLNIVCSQGYFESLTA